MEISFTIGALKAPHCSLPLLGRHGMKVTGSRIKEKKLHCSHSDILGLRVSKKSKCSHYPPESRPFVNSPLYKCVQNINLLSWWGEVLCLESASKKAVPMKSPTMPLLTADTANVLRTIHRECPVRGPADLFPRNAKGFFLDITAVEEVWWTAQVQRLLGPYDIQYIVHIYEGKFIVGLVERERETTQVVHSVRRCSI